MKAKFKNNSKIGVRIRESREKEGRSRNELADTLGISLSALQAWEMNEREPQASMILQIAEELNVSPSYLLTGEEPTLSYHLVERAFEKAKSLTEEMISMIDSFFSINVSAGFGSFNEGVTEPDGQEPYADNLLQSLGVKAHHCAVFWASGNSMQPTIDNGDQLLVDLSRKEIKGDNIYLVQNGDSVWVKRVRVEWDSVELISDNREYRPIKMPKEEAQNLQIIGQVVHVGHSLI